MDLPLLQRKLKSWFSATKRDLPWRRLRSPYATLVAEVMLQQTRASVVVPYFHKWMETFPTLASLAKAQEEEVLKTWEGLGYYSRARRLHGMAKSIIQEHNGLFPEEEDVLKTLKGLGPYTIGALRAFAFKKRAAAVDGNVIRVLTRLFGIEEEVSRTKTVKDIWAKADSLLPEDQPWLITEALIELGALVCTKTPQCESCPLLKQCKAKKKGIEKSLPLKKPREKTIYLTRTVAVVQNDNRFLVTKEEEGVVMSGLYQFPYDEHLPPLKKTLDLSLDLLDSLPEVTHSFTKYRVTLIPYLFTTHDIIPPKPYEWKTVEELEKLPFSSGHRRIWRQVKNAYPST